MLSLLDKYFTTMQEKIEYSEVPSNYMMCLNQECTKADNCLRQLAWQSLPPEIEQCNVVSPKFLAALTDDCPYYKIAQKIRYAKGFITLLENLPHKQMQTVVYRLMNIFERRMYYRVRKGERLLSPDEQQKIMDIIEHCGISQPQEFDAYIENYDW